MTPIPTRHPNPAKERAAAALRARRGGPRAVTPARRPLRDRARLWLKYRARYDLRHPDYAYRRIRAQLARAWAELLCRHLGHDDAHPGRAYCPEVLPCVYCRRCGRTEHQAAPPLPLRRPVDLKALTAERDWLRARYYYATPDRSRLTAAEAYIAELAATYGLDELDAHRLARQRIQAGEWSPPLPPRPRPRW